MSDLCSSRRLRFLRILEEGVGSTGHIDAFRRGEVSSPPWVPPFQILGSGGMLDPETT